MKLRISALNLLSLVDIADHVSIVIWLPGCTYRCPWCQNAPIVRGEHVKEVDNSELEDLFRDASVLVDYVHVTGGEPTVHPGELRIILELARRHGLKGSIATNASRPEMVLDLVEKGLLQHVAIDVKAPPCDAGLYGRVIGLPQKGAEAATKVVRLIKALLCSDKVELVEARTTVVPGLVEGREVEAIAENLSMMPCRSSEHDKLVYVVQEFNMYGEFLDPNFKVRSKDVERVNEEAWEAARKAAKRGLRVILRGSIRGVAEVKP